MALVTVEELFRMGSHSGVELVDGELRKISPNGGRHGRIAARVNISLGTYVKKLGLGEILISEPGFILRRNPDTVRAPDIAFVRKERWRERGLPGRSRRASRSSTIRRRPRWPATAGGTPALHRDLFVP